MSELHFPRKHRTCGDWARRRSPFSRRPRPPPPFSPPLKIYFPLPPRHGYNFPLERGRSFARALSSLFL